MNIKPMLAYKAGIKPIDFSQQVYIQPKLDGVRCLFTKDGAFSRTGKQFMNVKHIENELQPLFNDYPNLILDGELYNHALKNDFEKIISLVRKQKPNPFDRSEAYEFVEFHWYDIIDDDNDILFIDRSKFIHELLSDFFPGADARHVFPLVTIRVDSLDKARAIHDANLAGGFEGSIIRLNKTYECKRSYNLQKFKDFSDKEATIIDYVEGKGKRAGTLGKFIMRDEFGIEFGCPPGKGYTHADLRNILNNIDEYIGKQATFTYFERTKANSYRHPQFKAIRNYE
jgi:ATP-dependent DNA ligase